jgi:hypothetical protein
MGETWFLKSLCGTMEHWLGSWVVPEASRADSAEPPAKKANPFGTQTAHHHHVLLFDSIVFAKGKILDFSIYCNQTTNHSLCLFSIVQSSLLAHHHGSRTVTTLKDTLAAQVPEKQAALGRLKKEFGNHKYVCHIYSI